jgi:hypothetical protein
MMINRRSLDRASSGASLLSRPGLTVEGRGEEFERASAGEETGDGEESGEDSARTSAKEQAKNQTF